MGKKKKKIKVGTISGEQVFHATKERYNPYQTGHGAWKDKRYPSRNNEKAKIKKMYNSEY